MGISIEERLVCLERSNANLQSALEMLGMKFCNVCGRPHKSDQNTSLLLSLEGGASARVCADEVGFSCLRQLAYSKKSEGYGFIKGESTFAKWILVCGSFWPKSQMNSDVRRLVNEGEPFERSELAFQIIYWRNGIMNKAISECNEFNTLQNCGFNYSALEVHELMRKCSEFAARNRHEGQHRYFSSKVSERQSLTLEGVWSAGHFQG
jgi:hypothetical protein